MGANGSRVADKNKFKIKFYKIARKVFRRKVCRTASVVLVGTLALLVSTFLLLCVTHDHYRAEVRRLLREDKIFEYRRNQEAVLYAHCSYMGFTELNTKGCSDYCDEKADMWRQRKVMDYAGIEGLKFMAKCPPILDFQRCHEHVRHCNVERKITVGCPGTYTQPLIEEDNYNHSVPIADMHKLYAQNYRIVQASELVAECPVCEPESRGFVKNKDSTVAYKPVYVNEQGFPSYRTCMTFLKVDPTNTTENGEVVSENDINLIEAYENKIACQYKSAECRSPRG